MPDRAIFLPFDEEKATAAAGFLLTLAGGEMEYFRLLKSLYVSEREALRKTHRPICGGPYIAMKDGPLPGRVYRFIQEESVPCAERTENCGLWYRTIARTGPYSVKLLKAPSLGALSLAEKDILTEVHDLFVKMGIWRVRNWTHELPEWRIAIAKTKIGERSAKSIEISPDSILRAVGKSPEEIDQISEEIADRDAIRRLLMG
jgi:uncharacterized phage-associated protein